MIGIIAPLIVSLVISGVNLYNSHKRKAHPELVAVTASQQAVTGTVAGEVPMLNNKEYKEIKARMP